MATTPQGCEPERLKLLLEDRLPEDEQATLSEHLEACANCRRALEQLAATSRDWGDARLLRDDPAELAGGIGFEADEGDVLGFLDPPERSGSLGRLGPYEILEVIGKGGMGVVLKAYEPALNRTVAIKILAPTLATGATARRRFAREARAAAAVVHEHIVAIYAVDEFRGLPYLVMQHVPGRSLQQQIDAKGPLPVREILRIGMQAASALAAAHAQGVVHRDIKPGNILLENCVERVRLTDFGLARAADDASLTRSGVIAGTPQYMAPEQASGEPVDARADLYSLGVVLYAMATGRPPFRADSTLAVLKRVCEDRPRPIREINPDVPDWLASIIDRLMAKAPADRFDTAAEVSDLLAAGLAHLQQPAAHPRPRSPVVRNAPAPAPTRHPRRRLVLASGLLGMLAVGLAASEAAGLTQVADTVATVLRMKLPEGTLVVKVDDPEVKVRIDGEELIITGAGPQEIRLRPGTHRLQAIKDGRPVLEELITISRGGKEVVNVAVESDGEKSAGRQPETFSGMFAPSGTVGDQVETLSGMFAPSGTVSDQVKGPSTSAAPMRPAPPRGRSPNLLATIEHRGSQFFAAAFSPDGQTLAIAGDDGMVRLCDVATRAVTSTLEGHEGSVTWVAFSPAGDILASCGEDGAIRLWLPATGRLHSTLRGHEGLVRRLAFSPDGTHLASAGADRTARVWEVETGEERTVLKGHTHALTTVDFSPDGETLATGGEDWSARLWDWADRRLIAAFDDSKNTVSMVAFSPDGGILAGASCDGTVKLWDVQTRRLRAELIGHRSWIMSVAYSHDGRLLASGSDDQTVRLWDTARGTELAELVGHLGQIRCVVFSPDGETLASAGMDGTVKLWGIGALTIGPSVVGVRAGAREAEEATTTVPPSHLRQCMRCHDAPSRGEPLPEGHPRIAGGLLGGFSDHRQAIQPPAEAAPARLRELRPSASFADLDAEVWATAFSPDGKALVWGGKGVGLMVAEPPGRNPQRIAAADNGGFTEMAFLPDGKTLVTGGWDQNVRLWDAGSFEQRAQLEGHTDAIRSVAVSPDGTRIASGGYDRTVKLWDAAGGELLLSLPAQELPINRVAFAPDGETLLVASGDWQAYWKPGEVTRWDVASGDRTEVLSGHSGQVLGLAIAPDGRTIATGGPDGILLWEPDGSARTDPATRLRHDDPSVHYLTFSPDGRRLAAAYYKGDIVLWDHSAGRPEAVLKGHRGGVFVVAFSPDGRRLASAGVDGTLKLWDLPPAGE